MEQRRWAAPFWTDWSFRRLQAPYTGMSLLLSSQDAMKAQDQLSSQEDGAAPSHQPEMTETPEAELEKSLSPKDIQEHS